MYRSNRKTSMSSEHTPGVRLVHVPQGGGNLTSVVDVIVVLKFDTVREEYSWRSGSCESGCSMAIFSSFLLLIFPMYVPGFGECLIA